MASIEGVKNIIAVSSCKGGVGKSTIAAAVARELCDRGYKTGLLDADVYGPSGPSLFHLYEAELTAGPDKKIIPVEVNGLKIVSFGFASGDDPAVLRGPIVSQYIQQLALGTGWGTLDFLILDMPPGTGDIQLTISQTLQLDGAIIVTTPQALSLVDVGKGIKMFDKVNVEVLGVIENMAWYDCPKCGERQYIFGKGGAEKLYQRFGTRHLGGIPLDPQQYSRQYVESNNNKHISTAVDAFLKALDQSQDTNAAPLITNNISAMQIELPDTEAVQLSAPFLRKKCQCALCVNELTGESMLAPQSVSDSITIEKITTIGRYAVNISFSDGHSSGIYPYTVLLDYAFNKKGL